MLHQPNLLISVTSAWNERNRIELFILGLDWEGQYRYYITLSNFEPLLRKFGNYKKARSACIVIKILWIK